MYQIYLMLQFSFQTQDIAIRCIQKNVRKFMGVREWPWWRLLIKITPMLNVHRTENQLKSQTVSTVPVIWNWKNRCILGVFVTQKFYLHELWNLHVIRMCPKASLTNRLWEIRNSSTQSWDIVILRKQDWSIFAQFSAF